MCDPENEQIAWGGAAAEDGADVIQLFGGHAAGGRGVDGSIVKERIVDGCG